MKKIITFTLCILICLSIGAISGIATSSEINNWHFSLVKPSFNPPNYLFGPVWTVLYLLMGISIYLIIQCPKSLERNKAIKIFSFQLGLNFLWSFIFFKFHNIGLAFIEIIALWISILAMIIAYYKINKTAAYLQIPYLLWVSFATVLNASFWCLNCSN